MGFAMAEQQTEWQRREYLIKAAQREKGFAISSRGDTRSGAQSKKNGLTVMGKLLREDCSFHG